MAELLLELFCEEIPARMQKTAAMDLARLVTKGLADAGLEHADPTVLWGPRRLTLAIDGLPTAQPDVTEEKKGPKVGAPEQAVAGFLKANGLASVDQAQVRELDGKGEFYFAVVEKKGRPTADVLAEILNGVMPALPWPKSMRWATEPSRWVRPLHRIVALFGGAVLGVEYAGVKAANITCGHRFLAPAPFEVADFADYKTRLADAKVVLDPVERRRLIMGGCATLAADHGLTVIDDEALLDEVTGLVEYPVPLLGSFDPAFLEVPPEVLTSAMRKHQKYFSVTDKAGKLAPNFIVIANMTGADDNIVAGNERVLRARLSDARFFWDQDRKQTLESRLPKLEGRIFHAKLGTDAERVKRIEKLAASLADTLNVDATTVARAARLCKADLVTEMVGEFPDLQGRMGEYYALHDGETPAVAKAIAEHYRPQGPADDIPTSDAGAVVALADKLDTLAGFFAIGETPTGSKDPFALRRAALGVIRIILEKEWRLDLMDVFPDAKDALRDFFIDRLKVQQRESGYGHDQLAAVIAVVDGLDLVDIVNRVRNLKTFLDEENGKNLLAGYKRAANILRIEEKKDGKTYAGEPRFPASVESADQALDKALKSAAHEVHQQLSHEYYDGAMQFMSDLREPVDTFFNDVMVNANNAELRAARLTLLSNIIETMNQVADFSLIEG